MSGQAKYYLEVAEPGPDVLTVRVSDVTGGQIDPKALEIHLAPVTLETVLGSSPNDYEARFNNAMRQLKANQDEKVKMVEALVGARAALSLYHGMKALPKDTDLKAQITRSEKSYWTLDTQTAVHKINEVLGTSDALPRTGPLPEPFATQPADPVAVADSRDTEIEKLRKENAFQKQHLDECQKVIEILCAADDDDEEVYADGPTDAMKAELDAVKLHRDDLRAISGLYVNLALQQIQPRRKPTVPEFWETFFKGR